MPRWGVISSGGSPVLLVVGWTVAANLQQHPFNPVADTISSLAVVGATDRWVMTWALAGVGAGYVVSRLALGPAALAGRLILMAVGIVTILVAVNPERNGAGGSVQHAFWAAVVFIAMTAWPAAARIPGGRAPGARPYRTGLRPAVSFGATVVMLGLLLWFGTELIYTGRQIGLAERVLASTQATWPLVVVLTCVRSAAARTWPEAGTPARSAEIFKSLVPNGPWCAPREDRIPARLRPARPRPRPA